MVPQTLYLMNLFIDGVSFSGDVPTLSLPKLAISLSVLTLGLFLFIVNALVFWAASGLMPGFHVNGFLAALLGSLIYSALGLCIDMVFSDKSN